MRVNAPGSGVGAGVAAGWRVGAGEGGAFDADGAGCNGDWNMRVNSPAGGCAGCESFTDEGGAVELGMEGGRVAAGGIGA